MTSGAGRNRHPRAIPCNVGDRATGPSGHNACPIAHRHPLHASLAAIDVGADGTLGNAATTLTLWQQPAALGQQLTDENRANLAPHQ
jgi:hypothetical protein